MHKNTLLVWLLAGLLLFSAALLAEPVQLKAMNLATAPKSARLLFDLSAPTHYLVSRTSGPERLVIRLENTGFAVGLKQPPANHPFIGKIKTAVAKDGLLVTVDLKMPVTHKSFQENRRGASRLVVELNGAKPSAPDLGKNASSKEEPAAKKADQSKEAKSGKTARKVVRSAPAAPKELVIAIDAGHGGKDTGAIGPNGTREKDVVFAIARKLEALIRSEPGMRPVMVRKGDQFINLRQRAEIARKARADLFVSLHADAYINGEAKGSSVFTLSPHGATSEAARWLADRENSADLVGGVKLSDKDKVLASVLLDLSQTATIEASDRAAIRILKELQKSHHLHHQQVQKAGFVVLKSPDIPSLLIETAFISNPDEEKNLRSLQHQELVARSIFNGIRSYCSGRRPAVSPATRIASTTPPDSKPVVVAEQQ